MMKKIRANKLNKGQWIFMCAFGIIPLVLLICFTVVPMGKALYTSFFDYNGFGDMTFIKFDNYKELLTDSKFWTSCLNDIKILFFKEIIVVVLTVTFSIAATRLGYGLFEVKFFRFIFYIPNILSAVVISKCWKYFFDFELFSKIFGLTTPQNGWINDYPWQIVTFVGSWCGVGSFMIILIAAINNIPKELYEAADLDGAGQFRQLFAITIPAVLPQVKYMTVTIVTSIVGSNMNFVKLFVSDNSQFTTMGLYQYNAAFVSSRYGYAYAGSVIVMLIVFAISFVINKFISGKEDK